MKIKIEEIKNRKPLPAKDDPLVFATIFTDHMFIMDYEEGKGWFEPRIVPYAPIALEPSALVLHYGQSMFEGLKAYRASDGRVLLFRPDKNIARANKTNERVCIPQVSPDDFMQAIVELVKIDKIWIPEKDEASLYIRPFIIATDPCLGVRPAKHYQFMIILSPVGPYYPEGINPTKIWVEDTYVRAVRGGLGEIKTAANYAASLKAQVKAQEKGYSQVLWLDAIERKYIEEVGAMNIFFKIAGKVITPILTGSILPGVTRDSCIELCKSWGYEMEERRISIDEVRDAANSGTLEEVWGTGTAAVISPVGSLYMDGKETHIADGKIGELSAKLYDTVTSIQRGRIEGPEGWVYSID